MIFEVSDIFNLTCFIKWKVPKVAKVIEVLLSAPLLADAHVRTFTSVDDFFL
jgi:hypothetical protein